MTAPRDATSFRSRISLTRRTVHLRREGPGYDLPSDRAAPAAGGRSERPDRPASTTSGSAPRAPSAGRSTRPPPNAWPRTGSSTTASTPRRSAAPTRAALLTGRNHHTVGMGGDHRDRHVGARVQLAPPEHLRAAGARRSSSTATRPRSSASVTRCPSGRRARWDRSTPGRAGGGGFEYFYGFIGGETNQYVPGDLRRHEAGRAGADAGGGLPLHRRHDGQGDRLGPPAEGADARQAVLHLLRSRRDPRAAPRPEGVDRQVQGRVRPGMGRAPRGDPRAAEGARRDPARLRAHRRGTRRSRRGTTCPTTSSRSSRARWRSTPASSSTPTTTSGASMDALDGPRGPRRHARSTTSSATTARPPRGRRNGTLQRDDRC